MTDPTEWKNCEKTISIPNVEPYAYGGAFVAFSPIVPRLADALSGAVSHPFWLKEVVADKGSECFDLIGCFIGDMSVVSKDVILPFKLDDSRANIAGLGQMITLYFRNRSESTKSFSGRLIGLEKIK